MMIVCADGQPGSALADVVQISGQGIRLSFITHSPPSVVCKCPTGCHMSGKAEILSTLYEPGKLGEFCAK